jgi:hypothetical protein
MEISKLWREKASLPSQVDAPMYLDNPKSWVDLSLEARGSELPLLFFFFSQLAWIAGAAKEVSCQSKEHIIP